MRATDQLEQRALPFADVAKLVGMSVPMLRKERSLGRGPKAFFIGKRLYVLREDAEAWLMHKAASRRT